MRVMKSMMLQSLCVASFLLLCACETARVANIKPGTIGTVWMEIAVKDGQLTVVSTRGGTPAFSAGLLPGDIITEIDGKETQKMTFDTASLRICGQAGTEVRPKAVRPSTQEVRECAVIRQGVAHLKARSSALQYGQDSPAVLSSHPAATPTALPLPTESAGPF